MGLFKSIKTRFAAFGIALFCFGYFAAYVPYSMMTKMITKGLFPGMNGVGFSGFEIQPVVMVANLFTMLSSLTLLGWWKYATHSSFLGISFPRPRWFTLISGICTSFQIVTTTMAYTFSGISIVFAMVLMRGGVLILAPIVDGVARQRKRRIYWPSWAAAGMAFAALLPAMASDLKFAITPVAALDIGLYLFVYFFRLWFMSNRAKSGNEAENKGYLAEEQLVANFFMVILLFVVGLFGMHMAPDSIPAKIWDGFTTFPYKGYFWETFMIGVCSYGTGIFGTLIFLDKRENTFTVAANRCASIIAGVIATYLLAIFYAQKMPERSELIGAGLIMVAVVFLTYRSAMDKRAADRIVKRRG